MQIVAALVEKPDGEFLLTPVDLDEPRDDEILVRIIGTGICHTDDVARSGAFQSQFPAIFGHEGSGIVERTGRSVTKVAPGDAVVLTFRSCGDCDRCRREQPAYCRHFPMLNFAGARPDGSKTLHTGSTQIASSFFGQSSFATYALAYEANVVKLESAEQIEIMGPLGCGVQTGAGAVLRSLNCMPGAAVLVTGCGAVGLSAVMAAKVRECAPIIAVEPNARRRLLALELGATHVIDPADGDIGIAVRAVIPGGVDYAIDTSGLPQVLAACLASLAPLGSLGLIGVPPADGGALSLSIAQVMSAGLTVRGIMEGDSVPDSFIPELVALYRSGRFPFDRLVRTYPFAEINSALADQHSGDCLKAVLVMAG